MKVPLNPPTGALRVEAQFDSGPLQGKLTHSLPLEGLGLQAERGYQMHVLLSDARYFWHGSRNFVELDPASAPAHVFRLRRRIQTERDFDYFM